MFQCVCEGLLTRYTDVKISILGSRPIRSTKVMVNLKAYYTAIHLLSKVGQLSRSYILDWLGMSSNKVCTNI